MHKALEAVLSSKLPNFTYDGETYNAETAMRLNKGNCMSLVVLATAYAKLFGLKFSYREVDTIPIFKKEKDIVFSSSHVQMIIYDNEFVEDKYNYYFQKPGVVIDYRPSKNTKLGKSFGEPALIAMYYRNLAADAMVNDNLGKAFMLAIKAYSFDKQNIKTINLLAIIHRRAKDVQGSENIYQAGLKIDESSMALINNYIVLLNADMRIAEAERYQDIIDQLDDPNPFHWLEQAYIAEKNYKPKKAVRYYKKALEKAPYLDQAYLGLYQIYYDRGDFDKAKSMLIKALEWTHRIKERKQYQQKLDGLAQL